MTTPPAPRPPSPAAEALDAAVEDAVADLRDALTWLAGGSDGQPPHHTMAGWVAGRVRDRLRDELKARAAAYRASHPRKARRRA